MIKNIFIIRQSHYIKGSFIIATVLGGLLSLAGCNKADEYFEVLQNQPEIIHNSIDRQVYSIDDTLTLQGRLNYPEKELIVTIGDARATVVKASKDPIIRGEVTGTIDRISVVITAEMGIGPNRAMRITSNGITIDGPSIEIVGDANSSILSGQLELVRVFDIPTGDKPVYCQSGNGNLYLWNSNKMLTRIKPDGAFDIMFDGTSLSDAHGLFTIETFHGGGLDANEEYFWFSATVKEPAMSPVEAYTNDVYKLCRYDIAKGELTVVNRSLYPRLMSQRTLAAISPFEGEVSQAKIFRITGVYPDTEGNVYFNVDDHGFVTRLNAAGDYSYLFDLLNQSYTRTEMIPQIKNPASNEYYRVDKMHELLPGVEIPIQRIHTIQPAEGLMYGQSEPPPNGYEHINTFNGRNIVQYGLNSQVELQRLAGPSPITNYYLTASFSTLTLPFSTGFQAGYLPLPDKKLLLLVGANQTAQNQPTLPAWCLLDFNTKTGARYARGRFEQNGYQLETTDRILNYDTQNMIYMTANGQRTIVKTRYK